MQAEVRRRVKWVVRRAERAQALWTVPIRRLYARGVLAVNHLTLPHFLGVGTPKAGTTWLHHNLVVHPGLYLPPEKEVHYFCHRRHRSLRYYASRFAEAGDRVRGEITPAYATLSVRRIEEIRDLMPGVRLLMLVRNPIDRAWSHAVMHLCRATGRAVDEVDPAEFMAYFTSSQSRAAGDIGRVLDRWLQVFPEEQMWVGFYDDISRRPRELLREVFDHLGVAGDVDWDRFPYQHVIDRGVAGSGDHVRGDTTPKPPERYSSLLRDLYQTQLEALHRRFGERTAHWS